MKLKSCSFFVLILFIFSVCEQINAQSPPWIWAKAINGINLLEKPSIAIDPSGSGNVYVTDAFSGKVDFDPGAGIFELNSTALYYDMFISKLDGMGNFVWTKAFFASPLAGSSYSYAIAVDLPGSRAIYTTGAFYGTVDFDPGPGIFNMLYTGKEFHNADIFISKLDHAGNFIWAKRMGGTGDAFGRSIAVDPSGNGAVYTIGSFTGTIDFDPGVDSFHLTSSGLFDLFISKLDSTGKFIWAKSIGGTKDDIGFSLALDTAGNSDVYITGDFTGTVDFDPGPETKNITSVAVFDIFILKLNSDGHFVWVKPIFGINSKGGAGYSIAIDPGGSGDIYTTGYVEGEVDFDPGKGIFTLPAIGENDVFISKLNSSGNFVFAKRIGGMGDDKGTSIAIDPESGNIYTTGSFSGTVDFDPGPDTFHLTSAHGIDMFISKVDGMGKFVWAKPIIGMHPNQGPSISLDGSFLYVAGLFFNPSLSFDSILLTNTINDNRNIFIAKLDLRTTPVVNVDFKQLQINIYPNPTSDQLSFEFDDGELHHVGITLINVLGENVFSSTNTTLAHGATIDVSTLASGVYFLALEFDGNRILKKVVKQ